MTEPVFDWRRAFKEADALPANALPKAKADRGRKFERILHAMFAEAKLTPRTSFRPKGEEVDGSIWFQGRTILVEAKWTSDPHPASSLYQFKGKVDGKIVGTLGIFISIGGFSADSVDALLAGKELNLILADGDDMRAIVDEKFTIVEAIERKLRAAGEAGTPFLPLTAPDSAPSADERQHLIVVEGRSDVRYFESVRRVLGSTTAVTFVPASGPMNMVPVTKLMLEVSDLFSKVTVIADGDLDSQIERLRHELDDLATEHELERGAIEVIVAQPEVEVVLGLAAPDTPWRERRRLRNNLPDDAIDSLIANSDLRNRAATDPEVAKLLRAIGVTSPA